MKNVNGLQTKSLILKSLLVINLILPLANAWALQPKIIGRSTSYTTLRDRFNYPMDVDFNKSRFKIYDRSSAFGDLKGRSERRVSINKLTLATVNRNHNFKSTRDKFENPSGTTFSKTQFGINDRSASFTELKAKFEGRNPSNKTPAPVYKSSHFNSIRDKFENPSIITPTKPPFGIANRSIDFTTARSRFERQPEAPLGLFHVKRPIIHPLQRETPLPTSNYSSPSSPHHLNSSFVPHHANTSDFGIQGPQVLDSFNKQQEQAFLPNPQLQNQFWHQNNFFNTQVFNYQFAPMPAPILSSPQDMTLPLGYLASQFQKNLIGYPLQ
jgi:hypothetical protein